MDMTGSQIKELRESVVTVLMKERDEAGKKPKFSALGSGFIIQSAGNRCLAMTCWHAFRKFDPLKHSMRARLCGQNLELDAEILYQDEARNLMLIRIVEMPRAYPVLEFCDSSNVPVRSNVLLVAYLNTFPNRFSFGPGPVPEVLLFMLPGACPGTTAEPPQDTSGVVSHTCVGHEFEGCLGGPLIFQGRVIGVHTGSDLQIRHGHATSTESVNAAMKGWLQIPPDVSKTLWR